MTVSTFTESCPSRSLGTFRLLFNQLILSLLNSTCDITTLYPRDTNPLTLSSVKFDFIIVGAGSTGSVIASRLTEIRDWNVLLIEAGDDPPIESDVPGFFKSTWLSPAVDFMYFAEESPHISRAEVNNRCFVARAKMVGGCSSHNNMIYARGSPRDYDRWAAAGNRGWDYASVLPYFKKLETIGDDRLRNADHGTSGPLYVGLYANSSEESIKEFERSMFRAAVEAGIPPVEDVAVKTVEGVGKILSTIKRGVRQNTAKAYLAPIRRRPNLYVLKRAYVTKVLIDCQRRAYGVTVYKDNEYFHIRASKEVIVSAGAVNSPQLLMLSGIGPKEHLRQFGLKTVQDLRVGYNLQDHYTFTGAFFTYDPPGEKPQTSSQQQSQKLDLLYQYLTKHTGDFASAGVDSMIFYDSTGERPDYPDMQLIFAFLPAAQLSSFFEALQLRAEIIRDLVAGYRSGYISIPYITSLSPGVQGRVYLKSANPFAAAAIDLDYPKNSDLPRRRMRQILRTLEFLEGINGTKSLRNNGIRLEKAFIKGCDGSWECLIPYLSSTLYHLAGTNKMGPRTDPDAVVDSALKVHGLKGLRIADASVMPHVVAGNTNIPCMMIGEKAADMIKREYGYA